MAASEPDSTMRSRGKGLPKKDASGLFQVRYGQIPMGRFRSPCLRIEAERADDVGVDNGGASSVRRPDARRTRPVRLDGCRRGAGELVACFAKRGDVSQAGGTGRGPSHPVPCLRIINRPPDLRPPDSGSRCRSPRHPTRGSRPPRQPLPDGRRCRACRAHSPVASNPRRCSGSPRRTLRTDCRPAACGLCRHRRH